MYDVEALAGIGCRGCGASLFAPDAAEALLDESGRPHVVCGTCGSENVLGYVYGEAPNSATRVRRGVPAYFSFVLWMLAVAMAILLLPQLPTVVHRPEPPANTIRLV